jgi:peptidoglycan hydrolase-like protein with peptidoglycan-binding domain
MADVSVRRVVAVAALAGALGGGAVAGAVTAVSTSNSGDNNSTSAASGNNAALATAEVVRTTLTNAVQVGGSIGYKGSYTITTRSSAGATYTWLPQVGDVVVEDHPVYSLDDQPVPLLYGALPAYRAFSVGMSDGADVAELTRDLITLGYGSGLSPSKHYSSSTASAVKRWQGARGLPRTGTIPLGEVVFEPGPIRITGVSASVGSPVGNGGGGGAGGSTVLTATGTTPVVTVDLDVAEEYLVKPGDAVSIVLPNGSTTVGGRIETVGTVATCAGGGGVGLAGGGNSGSADQSPCASGGSNSAPTVTVTITLDSTPSDARLDQAPVNVNITTQRARNVLAVPVNALLALAGGGFGVDVVSGHASRLVGVTTGLYSSTLVQVSGSGVAAGTRVEVPSS